MCRFNTVPPSQMSISITGGGSIMTDAGSAFKVERPAVS